MSLHPARSVIDLQGESEGQIHRLERTILLVDACIGARAGGAFLVAPQARNDDGLLDCCIIDDVPRTRMLALVPHFLKGTHVDQPDVTTFRGRRITITSPDDLSAHADGELLCTNAHRIECEVLPKRIRVVC